MNPARALSTNKASDGSRSPGFWRRRIADPVVKLLRQGTSPNELAFTFAVGTVCSLFPFLGTTTVLNLVVGWWQKLNQPVLQTLNQLLGPVQLVMILVYVRIGEWMWQDEEHRFSVAEMIRSFRDSSFVEFLNLFGMAGIHAFVAWVVTAPVVFAVVYLPLRPLMAGLARGNAPGRSDS